jgi:hypothetical protein
MALTENLTSRPLLDAIETAYRAELVATGSDPRAFLHCVDAFRRLHPALPWGAAAGEVARLLDRSGAGFRAEGPRPDGSHRAG